MRLAHWFFVLPLLCLISSDVSAKKKRHHAASSSQSATRGGVTGELSLYSFVTTYEKGQRYTSVNLKCKPGFKPLWHVLDAGPHEIEDYFACIPTDALLDYGRCLTPENKCEVQQAIFTDADNRPLSLDDYKVGSFLRSENVLPRCLSAEEAKPGSAVREPTDPEGYRAISSGPSAPGSMNCFPRCAGGVCEQTVLFAGSLKQR